MAVDPVVSAHYRAQQTISRRTAEQAQLLWSAVEPTSVLSSWKGQLAAMLGVLIRGQVAAATLANPYTSALAAAQELPADAVAAINPVAFAGVAADGRSLTSLLMQPALRTLGLLTKGADDQTALLSGLASLTRIVDTEISDASRAADHVGIVGTRVWVKHVRHVSLPACGRCVVLAGQVYSWSQGFQRHPQCFPAGVVVSGPAAQASTRRWYEGELVVLTTASGQELSATGNHPVLTDRGWLPANLLQPGDHVVRSLLGEGAVPLVVPDERQMPARIEDLWRPSGVNLLTRMPTASQDFHGDGGHGDVEVVTFNGLLRDGLQPASNQPFGHLLLSGASVPADAFAAERDVADVLVGERHSANRIMRGGGLGGSLFGGHLGRAHLASIGVAADLDALLFKASPDRRAADLVAQAQAVLALSGQVCGHNLLDGEVDSLAARWDAPGTYGSVEGRLGYAGRGMDLLGRLSGQVELDRVVDVRRTAWSGHVYNLNSNEGWYSANSLIVSNCDCTMVPLREGDERPATPEQLFAQMTPAEQARSFTIAGAEAIRLGADLGQIVNARRGMKTVGDRLVTTEGTSARGFAGRRMGSNAQRLMPEQILADSNGDRDLAIQLLERNGFLLPSAARKQAEAKAAAEQARLESELAAEHARITAEADQARIAAEAAAEQARLEAEAAAEQAAPSWSPPEEMTPDEAAAMQASMAPWTQAQRDALTEYTYGWAATINDFLRSNGRAKVGEETKQAAKDVQAAMRPLPHAVTVYRYVGVDAFGANRTRADRLGALVGKTLQDKGFMSTTLAKDGYTDAGGQMARAARRPVLMEIDVPAGTPAAYLEEVSAHPGQWEMLLDAGLKYRVAEVSTEGQHTVVRVQVEDPALDVHAQAPERLEADRVEAEPVPPQPAVPARRSVPLGDLVPEKGAEIDSAAIEQALRDGLEGTYAGHDVKLAKVTAKAGSVKAKFDIFDADGRAIGSTERTWVRVRGELVARHDLLKLDGDVQGQGLAKAWNSALADMYQDNGVTRIELTANIDVGGYAWASNGYDFADADSAGRMLARLSTATRAARTWLTDHAGQAGGEEYRAREAAIQAAEELAERAANSAFGADDYPSAWEISQLGRQPGQGRDDAWIGKAAMLGSRWKGVKWL